VRDCLGGNLGQPGCRPPTGRRCRPCRDDSAKGARDTVALVVGHDQQHVGRAIWRWRRKILFINSGSRAERTRRRERVGIALSFCAIFPLSLNFGFAPNPSVDDSKYLTLAGSAIGNSDGAYSVHFLSVFRSAMCGNVRGFERQFQRLDA
jgi:hypothetical protein